MSKSGSDKNEPKAASVLHPDQETTSDNDPSSKLPELNEGVSSPPSACRSPSIAPSISSGGSGSLVSASPCNRLPINRALLSIFDRSKVVSNVRLRHDINFDPNLCFRPILDGEMGRKRQLRASRFRESLNQELTDLLTDHQLFHQNHGSSNNWTLPVLLRLAKDIISTLVPERDHQFLNDALDVEHFMQQLYKGVANLEKLVNWFWAVLKAICAPMRDCLIDTWYRQLCNDSHKLDLNGIVKGLLKLMDILETMKLDDTNHHIRCIRPALIDDTVSFEQQWFSRKIQAGEIDVSSALSWYSSVTETHGDAVKRHFKSFGDSGVFFEGLLRLTLPSSTYQKLPSTFHFDEERMHNLRSDTFDAINIEICIRMYESFERTWSRVMGNAASTFNFNSLIEASHGSCSSTNTASDARFRIHSLYSRLISLLESSPPGSSPAQRWESMVPCIALQSPLFTHWSSSWCTVFEKSLASTLGDTDSRLFKNVEAEFHERLVNEVGRLVHCFRELSPFAIFSALTRRRDHCTAIHEYKFESPLREGNNEGFIGYIAFALAHAGTLNWRVWSRLFNSSLSPLDASVPSANLFAR